MASAVDTLGFPDGSAGRASACQYKTRELDPWVRKIPAGGHGNPLQSSCLENPMDREAWWATAHGIAKGQT